MEVDDVLHEVEPDAKPALGTIEGRIALGEGLEDPRQERRIDAEAVIAHGDAGHAVLGDHGELDLPAGLLVLRRVIDEVRHDLDEAGGIAVDERPAASAG